MPPLPDVDLILGLFAGAGWLTAGILAGKVRSQPPAAPPLLAPTHTCSGPLTSEHEDRGRPVRVGTCDTCGKPFRLEL